MEYKQLVKKFIDGATKDDMEKLNHKTNDFVEEVRKDHPEMVDKFLIDLDMALNPVFSEETAKKAVSKMKNKDGTTGEHWSYEITSKALMAKGYDYSACAWYYVLNLVYSLFYKQGRTDDTYIELAHDIFISGNGSPEIAKKIYKALNY